MACQYSPPAYPLPPTAPLRLTPKSSRSPLSTNIYPSPTDFSSPALVSQKCFTIAVPPMPRFSSPMPIRSPTPPLSRKKSSPLKRSYTPRHQPSASDSILRYPIMKLNRPIYGTRPLSEDSSLCDHHPLSPAESSASSACSLPSPFSRPSSPVHPMDFPIRHSTASSDLISPAVFRFDVIPATPPAAQPTPPSVAPPPPTVANPSLRLTLPIGPYGNIAHSYPSPDSLPLSTTSELDHPANTLLTVPYVQNRDSRTLSRTLSELLEGFDRLDVDCKADGTSDVELEDHDEPESDHRERARTPSMHSLEHTPSDTSSIHTPSISSEVETPFLPPQEYENEHTLRSKRSSYVLPRHQQPFSMSSEPQNVVTAPEPSPPRQPELPTSLQTASEMLIDPLTPLDQCPTTPGQESTNNSVRTRSEAPPPYTQSSPQHTSVQKLDSKTPRADHVPLVSQHYPKTRDSISTMKQVPLRLTSITLPPARPLRRLLRTDLPLDDRSSRQWDREKVATDVRQVVQRLKWDKAQKAWQLVRAAGHAPITRKNDNGFHHIDRFSLQSPTLQPIQEHREMMESILPPGQLEWALVDSSAPVAALQSQSVFRLCIAWRVSVTRNAFKHPFGAQDELRVFVLGRTKTDFYELHEKLLEEYPLEPKRHQWAQYHEISPMALASIEAMEKPADQMEEPSLSLSGPQWEAHREEMRREAGELDGWLQSLLRLKETRCADALQSDLVRTWMSPRRTGDCERVTEDWRTDSHGGEERIARALERLW